MQIPNSRYFKFRLRLRAFIFKFNMHFWYKRYELNTRYNNFISDYFQWFWEANSYHYRSFRHRWRLHKLLGTEFKLFVSQPRHKYLFMLCNWWLNAYEHYNSRLYYTNKAIERWG